MSTMSFFLTIMLVPIFGLIGTTSQLLEGQSLPILSLEELNDASQRLINTMGGSINRPTKSDKLDGTIQASHDESCQGVGCIGEFGISIDDSIYRGFVKSWKLTPLAGESESRSLQLSVPRLSFNFTLNPLFVVPNADICHLFATDGSPLYSTITSSVSQGFYSSCFDSRHVNAPGVFSAEEPPYYAFKEWQVTNRETKALCGSDKPDALNLRQAITFKVRPDMVWVVYEVTADVRLDGELCISVDDTSCVSITGNPQEIELPSSDSISISIEAVKMTEVKTDFAIAVRSVLNTDNSLKPQSMRAIRGVSRDQMASKGSFGDVRMSCLPSGADSSCKIQGADFASDMSTDVIENRDDVYDDTLSSYVLEREMKGFFCHKGTCVDLDKFRGADVQWVGFLFLLLAVAASAVVTWAYMRPDSLPMGQCMVKRPTFSGNRTYSMYGSLPMIDDIIGTSGAVLMSDIPMTADRRPGSSQLSLSELSAISLKASIKATGFRLEPNDDISNIKSFEVSKCEMHSAEKGSFCEWRSNYLGIADSFKVMCSPHRCLRDSISLFDGSNINRIGVECPGVSREAITICIMSASQNICTTAKEMTFQDLQTNDFGDVGDEDSNPTPKPNQKFWPLLTFNMSVAVTWFLVVILSMVCTSIVIPNFLLLLFLPCKASAHTPGDLHQETALEVILTANLTVGLLAIILLILGLKTLRLLNNRKMMAGALALPLINVACPVAEANVVTLFPVEAPISPHAEAIGLTENPSTSSLLAPLVLSMVSVLVLCIILGAIFKVRKEILMLMALSSSACGETCQVINGRYTLTKTLTTATTLTGCYLPYDGWTACASGNTCVGKYFTMTSDSTSVTISSLWPIYPHYGLCMATTSQLIIPCTNSLGPTIPCTRRTIYSPTTSTIIGCKYYPLDYFCPSLGSGTTILYSGTTATVCANLTAGCTGPSATTWGISTDYDGSKTVRACITGSMPDISVVAIQAGAPAVSEPTSYCANAATNAEIIGGFSFAKAGLSLLKTTRQKQLITCASNVCSASGAVLQYNTVNGAVTQNGLWGECAVGLLLGTEQFVALVNASLCRTKVTCRSAVNGTNGISTISYDVSGTIDFISVSETSVLYSLTNGLARMTIRNTSGETIEIQSNSDGSVITFYTNKTTSSGVIYFGTSAYGSFPDCFRPSCKAVSQLALRSEPGQSQKLTISRQNRDRKVANSVLVSLSSSAASRKTSVACSLLCLIMAFSLTGAQSKGARWGAAPHILGLIICLCSVASGIPSPPQSSTVSNLACTGTCSGGNLSISLNVSPKLREVRVRIGKTCVMVLDTTLVAGTSIKMCRYPSITATYSPGNLTLNGEMNDDQLSKIILSGQGLKERIDCTGFSIPACSMDSIREPAIPQTCGNAGVVSIFCSPDLQEVNLTQSWAGNCEANLVASSQGLCVEMVNTASLRDACAFYPYYACDKVKVLHMASGPTRGNCGFQRALTDFKDPNFWDMPDPKNLFYSNLTTRIKVSTGDYLTVFAMTGFPDYQWSTTYPFTAYLGFSNQSGWNPLDPLVGVPWADKISKEWVLTDVATAEQWASGSSMNYYLCSYGSLNTLSVVSRNATTTNFMQFPLALSDTNKCGAVVVGMYPLGYALDKVYIHVISSVGPTGDTCKSDIIKAISETVVSTGDFSISDISPKSDGGFAADHVTVEVDCTGTCTHRMDYAGRRFQVTQRPKNSAMDKRISSLQWKQSLGLDEDDLYVVESGTCDESSSMVFDGQRMITVKPGYGSLRLSCDLISIGEDGSYKLGCDGGKFWGVLKVCNSSMLVLESGPMGTEVDGFPAKILNRKYKVNVSPVDLSFRPSDGSLVSRSGRQYVSDGAMILSYDNGKTINIKTAGDPIDVPAGEPRRTLLSFASGGLRTYSVTGKHQQVSGFWNGWSSLLSNFPLAVWIPVVAFICSISMYILMVCIAAYRSMKAKNSMIPDEKKRRDVSWGCSPKAVASVIFLPGLIMCRSTKNLYSTLKRWGDVTSSTIGSTNRKSDNYAAREPERESQRSKTERDSSWTEKSPEDEARSVLMRRLNPGRKQ